MKLLLIFPPNWSACINGPHLALPLIAGSLKTINIEVEICDLSEEFYRIQGNRPDQKLLLDAVINNDFSTLDQIYFKWEDSFLDIAKDFGCNFGLLSGFNTKEELPQDINQLIKIINRGTVYTSYLNTRLVNKIILSTPSVIGLTVSSQYQFMSAIEIAMFLRKHFPEIKLIVGGNVITRIRNTKSYHQLEEIFDKIIIFQGEIEIVQYVNELLKRGDISHSNNQNIEPSHWPVPNFAGLPLNNYPGINCLPFVSTRGCYYSKCSFCAIPKGWAENGYAGSMGNEQLVEQLGLILHQNDVNRIKFVDETFLSTRVKQINKLFFQKKIKMYWEAYARVEKNWESDEIIEAAFNSGCRKLYFGLEISPDANRVPLGKSDNGNIIKIMKKCQKVGILIHLFCMVGHPLTSKDDAYKTTKFLVEYQELIDTADIVGFRLDRGTKVTGVVPSRSENSDFALSLEYISTKKNVLSFKDVIRLEKDCQEIIWNSVPRLLHPLYRISKSWKGEESANYSKNSLKVLVP